MHEPRKVPVVLSPEEVARFLQAAPSVKDKAALSIAYCPKCQGAAAKQWLAERAADLLPVPYYHIVFTLPAPISDIAYQNKAVIYDILFKASAATLITIAADPKHLAARVGITSVRHTWGSALTHHPHVHMIVPGGGISLDGRRWRSCRPGFFLPVRVLSRLFRRLFLERLLAAHAANRLKFFGAHAALANPRAFAAYLAPSRKAKTMTLATTEFIRRFLIHVLPSGFHRIRHYGLFASGSRIDNIARARALLTLPPPPCQPNQDASTDDREPKTLSHSCPCCGGRMIIIETFRRASTPRYRPTAPTPAIRIDTS
jgi:hypothetical protein